MKITTILSAIALGVILAFTSCEPKGASDQTIQQDSISNSQLDDDSGMPHTSIDTTKASTDSVSSKTGGEPK